MNRSQRMRRKRQMQRRRRFFSCLFLIIGILILRKIDIFSFFKPSQVDADDLSRSISLMADQSFKNQAYNKRLEEVNKIRIEEYKKEKLREEEKVKVVDGKKLAYLTFDDGPSPNVTPQILDILKEEGVVGTFFVIGQNAQTYPDLVKRANSEGHAIANHSYSHDYSLVYNSTDSFIAEMKKTEEVLKNILGNDYTTKVVRFPGGSHGDKKNPFKEAALANGYKYYDWNALNGDAEGKSFPKDVLVNRLKETSQGQKELVVLMHDMGGKQTTADALPEIIEFLKSEGYSFEVLR